MKMKRRRLVYMGTPDFAVPPLHALCEAGLDVAAVFTQPDRPAGRGRHLAPPPVKTAAQSLGLSVFQPTSLRDTQVIALLADLDPEVIVVAAYAQLLPRDVLNLPRFGCKNIHASLLPKYRGGAPVHWAIVDGEKETGITIMHMARGLDKGDIIMQESMPLGLEQTCGEVTAQLSHIGARLILNCLELADLGESLRQPQEESLATYAPNVKKSDGLINWAISALSIHNQVRGFNPWPGAHTSFQGQSIRVVASRISNQDHALSGHFGRLALHDGRLLVGTGEGALELERLLPSGKRLMSGEEFFRGYVAKVASSNHSFE